MNKKTAIAIAAPYFKSHPKVLEFHVTADAQVFENKTQAANHAKIFPEKENQVIVTVSREDEIEASEVIVAPDYLTIPAGTTLVCDDPDSVRIISTADHVKLIKLHKNEHASDTKATDVSGVKTSAESIDDIEPEVNEADKVATPVDDKEVVSPGASTAQTHGRKTAKKSAAKK